MSKIVADNTSIYVYKCKDYGVKYIKEYVYKHKLINNIPLTKTQLNKFNKRQLFNFIDTHKIDIDKYKDIDNINHQYKNIFMFKIRYFCKNPNSCVSTMKITKYLKFVNHFKYLFCE